jgi:hypothetical protein
MFAFIVVSPKPNAGNQAYTGVCRIMKYYNKIV